MGLIRTELMPDSSEVVPYDHAGIPLYIRAAHLASYYNMCALITCVLPATGMMILNGSILSLEK